MKLHIFKIEFRKKQTRFDYFTNGEGNNGEDEQQPQNDCIDDDDGGN